MRPLYAASKLVIDRYTGELPTYDFGFGAIPFDPALIPPILDSLNNLLYYAQKDGYSSERLFQAFWEKFLLLNQDVACVDAEDSENMRKIRDIEKQVKALEKIVNGETLLQRTDEQTTESTQKAIKFAADMERRCGINVKEADDEPLDSLEQKVADYIKNFPFRIPDRVKLINFVIKAIQRQLESLHEQRDEQYKKLLKSHGYYEFAWKSVAWEYGIGDYVNTGLGLQRRFQVPQYFKNDDEDSITLVFAESKEYTRLYQEQRLLEHVSFYYNHEENEHRSHAYSVKLDLEREMGKISPTRKVGDSRMLKCKAILWQVIELLIAEPLTEDKPELSSQEIADNLKGLEERHGYAKIEGKIYSVKTLELPSPCGDEVKSRRWGSIIAHTKEKYCRGRKELENEIAAAYQISPPAQEKTKVPEKRDLEKNPERKPIDKVHPKRWDPAELPILLSAHPLTHEEFEGNYEDYLRLYHELQRSGRLKEKWIKDNIDGELQCIREYTIEMGFEIPSTSILDGESVRVDNTQQQPPDKIDKYENLDDF